SSFPPPRARRTAVPWLAASDRPIPLRRVGAWPWVTVRAFPVPLVVVTAAPCARVKVLPAPRARVIVPAWVAAAIFPVPFASATEDPWVTASVCAWGVPPLGGGSTRDRIGWEGKARPVRAIVVPFPGQRVYAGARLVSAPPRSARSAPPPPGHGRRGYSPPDRGHQGSWCSPPAGPCRRPGSGRPARRRGSRQRWRPVPVPAPGRAPVAWWPPRLRPRSGVRVRSSVPSFPGR